MCGRFKTCWKCKIFVTVLVALLCRTEGSILDNIWIETPDSGNVPDNPYMIMLVSTLLKPYGINVLGWTHLFFDVMSCSNAYVTLEFSDGVVSAQPRLYELAIGVDGDNVTLYSPFGDLVYTETVPNVLNCKEFRSFWLTWDLGVVRAGIGEVLMNEFIEWDSGESFINLQPVALRTDSGSNGTWIIHQQAFPSGRFLGLSNTTTRMALIRETMDISFINCALLCKIEMECLAIGYNWGTSQCRLIRGNQPIRILSNPGAAWTFSAKCLQEAYGCGVSL